MNTKIQISTAYLMLAMMSFQILPRITHAGSDDIIYPLKKISTLECRFEDFDTLSGNCIQDLPILKTKDYNTYATQNGGYNQYTRIYTVLWGSSYKYGWDVGSGGHQGTDIATAKGTPVYTIADGEVIAAGEDVGWGNYVSIEHSFSGKKVISNYAHLSKVEVEKWDSVDVGEKIGEVGSTGNSSGNHLHFQIDLPNKFHPYYYDYSACPYSYYDITEKGVCFNELQKNTIDPLAFLESNGAILDQKNISSPSVVKLNTTSNSTVLPSIFDITVYHGYGNSENVKQVQQVMKDLGYYDGKITGDYADVEPAILDYQLTRGIIQEKTDDGAGWFGPKTRALAKSDYTQGEKTWSSVIVSKPSSSDETYTPAKVETVSREKLMTREEIEAREIQEFLDAYKINFTDPVSQLSEKETRSMTMMVETSRGKWFRGNSPGSITFEYDESKISIFPKSFYNFSDGTREVSVTGKAQWNTTVQVKIGQKVIKSFSVTVAKSGDTPKVESAKIYSSQNVVLAEATPAIVLLKDQYGNKMVRSSFEWTYSISSDKNLSYCIKKGSLSDIKAIYKRPCLEEEFHKSLSFNYEDTIGGLLVFEYKVHDTGSVSLKLSNSQKELTKNTLKVEVPKGLVKNYIYYDDIVSGLSANILSWVKNGYFLEDRNITKKEASVWIESILRKNTVTPETIVQLREEVTHTFETLSRDEFALLTQKYLWSKAWSSGKDYRDLEESQEIRITSLVGPDFLWKDEFSQNYFQPDKKITRWEAAYFLTQVLKTQGKSALVLR